MRHKRAKTYKRAISIYTTAFGFRQPYQVLGELRGMHVGRADGSIE